MRGGDRWEVGSAFPLMLPRGLGRDEPPEQVRYFGSGRQALRALIEFGRREYGWQAVHVPAYYSPSVVQCIVDLLPVRRYDAGPMGPHPRPEAGPADAVITVSYFGEPPILPSTPATLIIDVTHDPVAPWLDQTRADYVVASLHKTLPLPDGGVLWSGNGRALPPAVPPTEGHLATVSRILSAMCLKAAYLEGSPLHKEQYLPLYAAGDAALRSTTVSGISDFSREALRVLPAQELRRHRMVNAAELTSGLRDLPGVMAHTRTFGVVLEFDSPERREAIRHGLIARSVYPAVLWSLTPEDTPPHQLDFSRRMLHLHTDLRWSSSDMRQVAAILRELCHRYPSKPYVGSAVAVPNPVTMPPDDQPTPVSPGKTTRR
ncbi:hypothetical protein [Micromonospora sp. NPDC005206]|uniref:hypothetical protein n=1 Tax=Micromonospora sp. NPDC005206 TaxID=3157022 RepID=UPI0033A40C04